MENQLTPPTAAPVTPPAVSPPQNQKLKHILMLILGLLIVATIAVVVSVALRNRPTEAEIEPPVTIEGTNPPATDPEEEDWVNHTNTDPAFSIDYPDSWTIDTTESELDQATGQAATTLTKGDYQFIYATNQNDFGPIVCLYADSPATGIPQATTFDNYVEIVTEEGVTYRRASYTSTTGTTAWMICRQTTDGFAHMPGPRYITPADYDTDILEEMDQILITLDEGAN